MQYKKTLRLAALLLAVTLLLTGCFGPGLPFISPFGTQIPAASTAAPTAPAASTQNDPEPTQPTPETTEPVIETTPPFDPNDEAMIRWQNAGQKDYLPEEKLELVPFGEMVYTRPDVEQLCADFDNLIARAADSSDAEALLEEFYALYTDYISFYSMDTLANIRYSLDTTDEYYRAEYDFCEEKTPNVEEKLEALNKAFAASPAREALEEEYFGAGYFARYDDYEVYTNPEYLRLSKEEAALLSEFRELTADPVVSYNNETKPLDEWLETEDYFAYIGALQAYYKQYNAAVGEVYVRLVKVRQALAKALDYDSYADYSYEVTYTRDYSPAQGSEFLAGIREHLVPVLLEAEEDYSLSSPNLGSASEQSVMDLVASAAQNLGGSVWDAYRFMRAYELCDISQSPKKVEGSFQTYIFDYESPYVLVNAVGSGEDYSTFAHEFGHFTDAYHNYGANEDLETAETFSQAMEFLALQYNDVLPEKQRNNLLRYKLYDLLQTFVYQAAYADFEDRVFALEPDSLSVERINGIFLQCCKDYGIYEPGFDFYYTESWIDVLHFFEVPYYIISYCVSAETALQVYELEQAEHGAGAAAFFRLLDRDYSAGVQQVMEDAELENPFREEVIRQTADFFTRQLGLKKQH